MKKMKGLKTKKIFRSLLILITFIMIYIISISIANNLILTPMVNYLAKVETARIFVSCILGWYGLSSLFNMFVEGNRK